MQTVPTSKIPMYWQTFQWILNPLDYMKENYERFGDIFEANIFWGVKKPFILVHEPNALQYLFTHDIGKEFSAPGEINHLFEPLLGKQNLMMMSGNQHRKRRQLVMPLFHGECLQAYGQIIQRITQEVIDVWPVNTIVDIRILMNQIAIRVILQVVFGVHKGDRYKQIERLLTLRLSLSSTPLFAIFIFFPALQKDFGLWQPTAYTQKMAAETDDLLLAEIQERRANPDPSRIDVLSVLVASLDEEGNGLTDQELRDELMTLIVAGHDTTATALSWTIYWIHTLPEVKHKLLAELDSVRELSDISKIAQLSYLAAVCNESLRIHPPAMITIPRRVESLVELCGYQLEPDNIVLGCVYLLHHRKDLYPEPNLFNPDRFLKKQFSPYEFMPFGGGIRRCIGSALVLYEMKIVISTILKRLDLVQVNKHSVSPQRRGVNLGLSSPVRLRNLGTRSGSQIIPLM